MSTRPVAPIDPAGNSSDRFGTHGQGTNVGPPGYAAPIVEPMPDGYAAPHTFPYSDTLNWPAVVQEMLKPSTSATIMASTRWITGRNVLADPDGLMSPFASRQEAYVPIPSMAMYTANYLRKPNMDSGVPQGVKMSVLSSRFAQFLRQVQSSLIGSP